ncbi:MAG: D-inositol-3-phosphate glycosyltransferase [Desulfovibrio sp.]
MKIIHANTHANQGGAAVAATRLHTALLQADVHSRLAVLNSPGETSNSFLLGGKLSRRIIRPAVELAESKLLSLAYRRPVNAAITTFSLTPSLNHARLNAAPKDILHLHWVNGGFLSPYSLERLRGPLVWTMHDAFPFTGGCHFTSTGCGRYTERCGKCPELCSAREVDLSRLHWLWKRRAIKKTKPVIVSPCREYADRAKRSGMLHDCRIEVIPNGLDINVFRPIPKNEAREILGLPPDGNVLLFGAVNAASDTNKGFDLLLAGLDCLRQKNVSFHAAIFGARAGGEAFPIEAYNLGVLHDEVSLRLAYSAADIFICPSRQENLPNTVMEAMACGTPVVGFAVGGIPDMVEDGVSGFLATPHNPQDLARTIGELLTDASRRQRMGEAAREKIKREFSLSVVAQQYIELYRSIIPAFDGC